MGALSCSRGQYTCQFLSILDSSSTEGEPVAFDQMIPYVVDLRVKTVYSIKVQAYQIINFISYIF